MDYLSFYILAQRISSNQEDVQRVYEEIKVLIDVYATALTIYVMQEEDKNDQWLLVLLGTIHPDPSVLAQIQNVLTTIDAQAIEITPAATGWFVKDYIARQIGNKETSVVHLPSAQTYTRGKRLKNDKRVRKKRGKR